MDLEDAVLSEISHGRDKRSENRLTEKRWVAARRAGKGVVLGLGEIGEGD